MTNPLKTIHIWIFLNNIIRHPPTFYTRRFAGVPLPPPPTSTPGAAARISFSV
jgi:hypothetical protein